jgi:GPI ethanolamine phosphate transferase 3 subunit O
MSSPSSVPSRLRGNGGLLSSESQGNFQRKPTDVAILKFLIILLFFLSLHLTGLFFFTRGFLLTRLVLQAKSSCSIPPVELSSPGDCWYPQQFQKAIIVLIDALRYDFTVPYPESQAQLYHNAFTTPYNIASTAPEHAFLLKFVADPPTTTLQRLKGLTTGSLPSFIDAGSNFAGTAIEEDNLISQLFASGRRIALWATRHGRVYSLVISYRI